MKWVPSVTEQSEGPMDTVASTPTLTPTSTLTLPYHIQPLPIIPYPKKIKCLQEGKKKLDPIRENAKKRYYAKKKS